MANKQEVQIVVVFHENRRRYERKGKIDPNARIRTIIGDFEKACNEFTGLTMYDYEVYDAHGKRLDELEQIGPYAVYLKILTFMPFDPIERKLEE